MRFHFCREGETVLSIARDEGISPVRLLEDNALTDPDRLAVGQCLAIYTPSKLYTVRGGDTLRAICAGLGVNELLLRRFNPSIGERGILYPGQTLSLGRGEAPIGTISTVGLASSRISLSILQSFISALTYLAIIPSKSELRSGFQIPKNDLPVALALKNGVLPFLGLPIYALSRDLLLRLKERGYAGVLLEEAKDGSSLASAVSAIHAEGLLSICRLSETADATAEADLIIRDTPSPDEAFSAACRRLAAAEDPLLYRSVTILPSRGVIHPRKEWESVPCQSECAVIAYRRNRPILRDGDDRPYFRFTRTKHGEAQHHSLSFEDLASIRKGLTLLGESSAAGIALRLEEVSPAIATLLCYSFDIIRA